MYKKALIICASFHHNNTDHVAKAMGKELNAEIIKPNEFNFNTISEYDLIGFGSGIYHGKHHKSIFDLIEKIETQNNKHAFIFSTCTVPVKITHKEIKENLVKKGFKIIDEFYCKGFMDYSFTKYLGGLNKGRPNDHDLRKAIDFANKIKYSK